MSDESKESEGQAAESTRPHEAKALKPPMQEDEINRILAAHKQWLESQGKNGKQADFRKANLERAKLKGVLLAGAKFQGCYLVKADLQEADLRDAELQNSRLVQSNLQKADLATANLNGAVLAQATLREARLQDADLTDVVGLLGKQLAGTDVSGAKLPDDIAEFKGLDHVTEISKHARNIFLTVLGGCLYSWLEHIPS